MSDRARITLAHHTLYRLWRLRRVLILAPLMIVAAAAFAGAGAVLTFFGFMHGAAVGFAVTPMVAVAYGVVAGFLFLCAHLEWADQPEPDGAAEPAE